MLNLASAVSVSLPERTDDDRLVFVDKMCDQRCRECLWTRPMTTIFCFGSVKWWISLKHFVIRTTKEIMTMTKWEEEEEEEENQRGTFTEIHLQDTNTYTRKRKKKDMQRIIILISTAMDVGVGFSSNDTLVIRVRLIDITWQKRTTVEGVFLRVIRYSFSSKRQRGFGIGVKRISIRKKPMSTLTHRTTAATVRMAESLREDPLLSTLFYDQ